MPEPRFKLDENMPREAILILGSARLEAFSVFDEHLEGADDSGVIAACKKEGLVLITCDLHFTDIRAYPPSDYPGIVVLRPRKQGRPSILRLVTGLVPRFRKGELIGKLWIVTDRSVRVRDG